MKVQSKLWYFENFNLLKVLPKEELMRLETSTKMTEAPKKKILYFPGENANSVYLIKKGKVKISKISNDGKEIIIAILCPGDIFGESAILDSGSKREEIAEATEDTLLCLMFSEVIKELMQRDSNFGFSVTKLIGLRLKKIQSRFESLIFKTSEERVRSFIKEIADDYGNEVLGNSEEREVKLKLTHDDIGKLTATSRQTVTTVLNEMEREGLISYDRARVFVKKYQML